MRWETRPLPPIWPHGTRTPAAERRPSPFSVSRTRTFEELERELRALGVDPFDDVVVLEAGYERHEIRLDGRPRANASPRDPAVVISFEAGGKPLRFASDSYEDHDANLRAIAYTLEYLRALERYGVARDGRQYAGWEALSEQAETVEQAIATIRRLAGDGAGALGLQRAFRAAAAKWHPDVVGGTTAQWLELTRAWERVK